MAKLKDSCQLRERDYEPLLEKACKEDVDWVDGCSGVFSASWATPKIEYLRARDNVTRHVEHGRTRSTDDKDL